MGREYLFVAISLEVERAYRGFGNNDDFAYTPDGTTAAVFADFANKFKVLNDSGSNPSWGNILLEEVSEALAETEHERQIEELVQVAAVAVRMIESVQRRMRGGGEC
jgi:hypothetical protein